jgi:hypothetical protein
MLEERRANRRRQVRVRDRHRDHRHRMAMGMVVGRMVVVVMMGEGMDWDHRHRMTMGMVVVAMGLVVLFVMMREGLVMASVVVMAPVVTMAVCHLAGDAADRSRLPAAWWVEDAYPLEQARG